MALSELPTTPFFAIMFFKQAVTATDMPPAWRPIW
jgi:hypothetical protein